MHSGTHLIIITHQAPQGGRLPKYFTYPSAKRLPNPQQHAAGDAPPQHGRARVVHGAEQGARVDEQAGRPGDQRRGADGEHHGGQQGGGEPRAGRRGPDQLQHQGQRVGQHRRRGYAGQVPVARRGGGGAARRQREPQQPAERGAGRRDLRRRAREYAFGGDLPVRA
ncbi:hypothetical protein F4780DRAFT_699861 [Xylariomycetidae sp. FL0641]|nr:hypothetical protein F4780DRAFT_699861 [Xylariomycetidae sp. FL0641]